MARTVAEIPEPYDSAVREAVAAFGRGECLFAPNVITGFGRIEGHTMGVVANQPLHLAGCLDVDASEKAARFISAWLR